MQKKVLITGHARVRVRQKKKSTISEFHKKSSKIQKIRFFQKLISFDLNEIYHRYRYEKASNDPREHVSGHYRFIRPLPAAPGHYEYRVIMPNFTKSSKNPIFSIFQILSGSGRKCHIWPEIGHLGSGKCPETIKYPYLRFRVHFGKIEKNRHF